MRSFGAALAAMTFLAVASGPALAQPRAISAHGDWGAFRDGAACYAVAMASEPTRAGDPPRFVTVSAGPSPRRFSVRLGRVMARGSFAALAIGKRRFRLAGGGDSAWSANPGDDRAIVAAMRMAETLTISGRDLAGRRFRDRYRLAGAATAIDAATIACR